jgi:hypothetical protein
VDVGDDAVAAVCDRAGVPVIVVDDEHCLEVQGQLGVSTWSGTHEGWAIELEPLIVCTAMVAEDDKRLLRSSIDWCVSNHGFLSLRQVRHIVRAHRWPLNGPIGRFGSTVSKATGKRWPGAREEAPFEVAPSRRSQPPSLAKPELVQLRLRSIFGVTSRAEILRVLLIDPQREWSLAEITERVAYTRRQVTADLEMLTLGGLTHRRQLRGSFRNALDDAEGLMAWLGARPRVSIHWAPLFRVMTGLLEIVDGLAAKAWHMPAAELTHQMRSLAPELDQLRLRPPTPAQADTYVADTMAWAHELFAALADGDASRLPVDPVSTRPAGH